MSGKKFGVIVCTQCGRAKAVDLNVKRTECPYCGKGLKVSELKIYYEADSYREASWAVGRINSKMKGVDEEIEEGKKDSSDLDSYTLALKESSSANNERDKLTIVAQVLTSKLGQFGKDEITHLSERSDLGSVEELIEKFRKLDGVFEPENETFKAV